MKQKMCKSPLKKKVDISNVNNIRIIYQIITDKKFRDFYNSIERKKQVIYINARESSKIDKFTNVYLNTRIRNFYQIHENLRVSKSLRKINSKIVKSCEQTTLRNTTYIMSLFKQLHYNILNVNTTAKFLLSPTSFKNIMLF